MNFLTKLFCIAEYLMLYRHKDIIILVLDYFQSLGEFKLKKKFSNFFNS